MWISLWVIIPLLVAVAALLGATAIRLISEVNDSLQRVRQLEYVVNNIPDLVIRVDRQNRITYMNAASLVYFSKEANYLAGRNLFRLFRENFVSFDDQAALDQVFESENPVIRESRILAPEQPAKYLEIRILPEPHSRRKSRQLIILMRDITVRKEAEAKLILARQQAEENDRRKSAFLANMSHEIRTPLNAIVGFSQIILEEDLSEEQKNRYFEYINQNNNQLINLVNDIIDISKLESNQFVIRTSVFNLNRQMDEVFEIIENEKRLRGKSHLLVSLDKGLPDNESEIETDLTRLRQILTNLLVNSVKFTPKGFIQFGYHPKEENLLLFYVRDTGIGIPADKHDEIFQYFRQLDLPGSRSNSGTGLGLTISRNLVRRLGGSIWIESEPGKGTTFFFTLPVKPGAVSAPPQP